MYDFISLINNRPNESLLNMKLSCAKIYHKYLLFIILRILFHEAIWKSKKINPFTSQLIKLNWLRLSFSKEINIDNIIKVLKK